LSLRKLARRRFAARAFFARQQAALGPPGRPQIPGASLYLAYKTQRRAISHSYGIVGTSWPLDS
jgi:hypothetical protein